MDASFFVSSSINLSTIQENRLTHLIPFCVGVYVHTQKGEKRDKSGFPVFATVIEANCIQKRSEMTNNSLSDDDKRKIRELSQDPQVRLWNIDELQTWKCDF